MLFAMLLLPLVAALPLEPSTQDLYIIDIENGTLKNVQFRNDPVSDLDLSGCGIRNLEKNALDKVSSLISLNLANNSIESLPEFMFSNLTNLEYLSLAENKLRSLEYLFVHLEKLKTLNISCNPVMHLRRGHLFGLTKSTTILTERNVFWSVSTGTFTNSFLKDEDDPDNLEKLIAEVDMEQRSEAGEASDEDEFEPQDKPSTSTKQLLSKDQKLQLCMSNQILVSLSPRDPNTPLEDGCIEIPLHERQKTISLRGLSIKGFNEKWYQLQAFDIDTLDLGNNEITEITKEMLNDLPEGLLRVYLLENRIRKVWSQVIENRYIKVLNLGHNLIESIENSAFANTNLTSLYLGDNHLDSLSFVSSLPQCLIELVLIGNQISAITDKAFSNLTRLNYLNLDNNKIQKLQDNAFQGLDSLKVLLLGQNNLAEIERQAFYGLAKLSELHLEYNSLTGLQKGTFTSLERLKRLSLSWNKFETITKDTFADLPKSLDFLRVDFNRINSLEAGSFVSGPRIGLSLTSNRISNIPQGTFDLPTLRALAISNNTLTTIDGDSFEGLPQLKRLWLSDNRIREISKGACKNLGGLNILDISKNPFEKLENGALYGLGMIKGNFVHIYNNRMKELQAGVFEDA